MCKDETIINDPIISLDQANTKRYKTKRWQNIRKEV